MFHEGFLLIFILGFYTVLYIVLKKQARNTPLTWVATHRNSNTPHSQPTAGGGSGLNRVFGEDLERDPRMTPRRWGHRTNSGAAFQGAAGGVSKTGAFSAEPHSAHRHSGRAPAARGFRNRLLNQRRIIQFLSAIRLP